MQEEGFVLRAREGILFYRCSQFLFDGGVVVLLLVLVGILSGSLSSCSSPSRAQDPKFIIQNISDNFPT